MNTLYAAEFLTYLESAYKSNPVLNASRENYKVVNESVNISLSEFLPSVSISNSQNNQQNSNRTNQAGGTLPDNSSNSKTQSVSINQKIFQGFQGYNSIKKSLSSNFQNKIKKTKNPYFKKNTAANIVKIIEN